MKKTPVANEELTAWRRRVRQAQQIARLTAAGRRYILEETPSGRLRLYTDRPGRLIFDNHSQPLYRIIGAAH